MNYIKFKDKQLPIVVNFSALKKFQKQTKTPYNDIETIINDLDLITEMFWFALESGCYIDKITTPISKDEIDDVLNDSFGEFIKIYMEDVVKIFAPANKDEETTEVKKN